MNQGGFADTTTALEQNSIQRHNQIVSPGQGYTPAYHTPSMESGILSHSSYIQDQHMEPPSRNVQDGPGVSSVVPTTSNGAINVPHGYNSYTSYTNNTDPYSYSTNGYASYYSGYQQQSNQQYSQVQPIGAYQNTGAPQQPFSSFQNTSSYAGPTSYSSTYYNAADYQTPGGHASGSYNNQIQTNLWPQGNYVSYASNEYPNYAPDPHGANAASNTSSQYQQHYKHWADYYSQTEVSCAPGTENVSVSTSTPNPVYSVPITSGYSDSYIQPTTPYLPPWRPDSSYELPPVQTGPVTSGGHDGYWTNGPPGFQNFNSLQQTQFQKPSGSGSGSGCNYQTFQETQKTTYPQPGIPNPATHQVNPGYPSSLQKLPQTVPALDSRKVSIPTNPRIVSNVGLGVPKASKDSSTISNMEKPAYISVALPKADVQASSHDTADSMLKPGSFPQSLRGYVERALARCKDDSQKTACQSRLKEMITKATADGTLYTRDWDTEPLFSVPIADVTNKNLQPSTPISLLSKSKRSPGRRSKSRWEPLPEEKPVDNLASVAPDLIKYGGPVHFSECGEKVAGGKWEYKDGDFSNKKFSFLDQRITNKSGQRPFKRSRLGDNLDGVDNGQTSSDSDKEQSLTAYYSAASTLANSPEEKKRRENRSKRFDKGSGKRAANNHYKPKGAGAGNLYSRRATAMILSKHIEDGGSRAVEDIDWDALTVKGTCQEIEKCYLRLTSAPDPATVRPEEVLEKALFMVQNSPKNYLYKCDQLKSIRQDLTVQRIRNELTVKVYETHARLAIEAGDLAECNQCQSQLKTLYAEGIKGCHMEFSAYDLLRVISHSSNNRDLISAMSRLSVETKRDEAVKHALAVRAAVTSGNYVLFFRLYKTAPNLNTCLMDLYVEKMRYSAVRSMSRSYRPTVPVLYIAQLLGFTDSSGTADSGQEKDSDGLEECAEWLKAHGACLIMDDAGELQLDTKASSSTLYMPDPEDAVAHGDTMLAVNDFLAKNPS